MSSHTNTSTGISSAPSTPASSPALVTTTGVRGGDLTTVRRALRSRGLGWSGDLTLTTRVLIVSTNVPQTFVADPSTSTQHPSVAPAGCCAASSLCLATSSGKLRVARERGVPCVSAAWVHQGACVMADAPTYDVKHSLTGRTVCTTGLSSAKRRRVRTLCGTRAAVYDSALTRNCGLLVIPSQGDGFDASANEKICFAQRHLISTIAEEDFFAVYDEHEIEQNGEQQRKRTRGESTSLSVVAPRFSTTSSDIPLVAFEERVAHKLSGLARLHEDMSDVTVYYHSDFCPRLGGTREVAETEGIGSERELGRLFDQVGVKRSNHVTDTTTHVLVFTGQDGERHDAVEESIFPRPGLEFVSPQWLQCCLAQQRRVACTAFRVVNPFRPRIVFIGLPQSRVEKFARFVRATGLHGLVQPNLVLCSASDTELEGSDREGRKMSPTTTHLVVPRAGYHVLDAVATLAAHVSKNQHLLSTAVDTVSSTSFSPPVLHCQCRCQLVDVEWVLRSLAARRWIDPSAFVLQVPSASAVAAAAAAPMQCDSAFLSAQPSVESPQSEQCAPPSAQPGKLPACVEEEAACAGKVGDEEEEGASQRQHSVHATALSSSQHATAGVTQAALKLESPLNVAGGEEEEESTGECSGEGGSGPSLTLEALIEELETTTENSHIISGSSGPTTMNSTTTGTTATTMTTMSPSIPCGSDLNAMGGSGARALCPDGGNSVAATSSVTSGLVPRAMISSFHVQTTGSRGSSTSRALLSISATSKRTSGLLFNGSSRAVAGAATAAAESQYVVYQHCDGDGEGLVVRNAALDERDWAREALSDGVLGDDEGTKDESGAAVKRATDAPPPPEPFSTTTTFVLLIAKDVRRLMDVDALLASLSASTAEEHKEDSGTKMTIAITADSDACTHFITSKPSKTEMFLRCVAAGKWVLAPNFLRDSAAAGRVVNESTCEWSPALARRLEQRSSVVSLVRSCQLQRRAVGRPYEKWDSVVLCCSSEVRYSSFARVLRSGGCHQVRSAIPSDILADATSNATEERGLSSPMMILADDSVWSEEQLMQLQTDAIGAWRAVPVLRLEYLVHCLSTEEPVSSDYEMLREVRLRKRSRVDEVL